MTAPISLPRPSVMLRAFMERDASYDGLFFTGVTTTRIFCRASCTARKPKPEHLRFFRSRKEAVTAGFRPCKRCRPLESAGKPESWISELIADLEVTPRITESQLRARGLDPARVRRAFMRHYHMSFQEFQRARRLGTAFAGIQAGAAQIETALNSGYESLSGFRDAYQRVFGTTPAPGKPVTIARMTQFETPLGAMLAICTDTGVRLLEFLERRGLETELRELGPRLGCTILPGENRVTRQLERELKEYFAGARREFTVAVEPIGTPFQRRVWDALLRIPYGETRSYGEQARVAGYPEAARAVGRANGDNKIAIVIPCHRVIGANGKLTGYGGELWRKKFLLELEAGQLTI